MLKEGITIQLPKHVSGLTQIEEYFILRQNGEERQIRLHDYRDIYRIPGLYEYLLSDLLRCESPDVISTLLVDQLSREQSAVSDLVVMELGAGTGMVGAALKRKGIESIFGVDIIEEAAQAARRDRPGVYTRYYVEDLCNLSENTRRELEAAHLNCLVCVSALGLNHVPAKVFAAAYTMIAPNGWVTFNVNENYLRNLESGSFPMLVNRIIEEGRLDIRVEHLYRHRFAVDGSPINYIAMVGRKRADIPEDYI